MNITDGITRYSRIVYLNSATGNDITGDGSSGNPLKTIAGAFNRYPTGNMTLMLQDSQTIDSMIDIVNRKICFRSNSINITFGAAFRVVNSQVMLESVTVNLSDATLFFVVGSCAISIGTYYNTYINQIGNGNARVIDGRNTDYHTGDNGTASLFINTHKAHLLGNSGRLDLIGGQNDFARWPIFARINQTTKDANAFWYNGSDTNLVKITGTDAMYTLNW